MVRRIYVEKKAPFAVKAQELKAELSEYLGIETSNVRILIRYDVENVSNATFEQAKPTVFSEPPVDDVYDEGFKCNDNDFFFTVNQFIKISKTILHIQHLNSITEYFQYSI